MWTVEAKSPSELVIAQLRSSSILPPGAVYQALATTPSVTWLPGPMIISILTVAIAMSARRHCVRELRAWFEGNQGRKVMT